MATVPNLFLTALALLFVLVLAIASTTSGSGIITINDYPSLLSTSSNNPPFCGMPYSSLLLARITAMQHLTPSDCGTCLEVCGRAGCAVVLAVDKGGRGLDLSTGARDGVLGPGEDIGHAVWREVDGGACRGIWDGRMFTEGDERVGKLGRMKNVRNRDGDGDGGLQREYHHAPSPSPSPFAEVVVSPSQPSSASASSSPYSPSPSKTPAPQPPLALAALRESTSTVSPQQNLALTPSPAPACPLLRQTRGRPTPSPLPSPANPLPNPSLPSAPPAIIGLAPSTAKTTTTTSPPSRRSTEPGLLSSGSSSGAGGGNPGAETSSCDSPSGVEAPTETSSILSLSLSSSPLRTTLMPTVGATHDDHDDPRTGSLTKTASWSLAGSADEPRHRQQQDHDATTSLASGSGSGFRNRDLREAVVVWILVLGVALGMGG